MESWREEKCFNLDVLWKTIKIKEKNSNCVLNLPALAHVLPAHETICNKFSFTQTPVQNCAGGLPLHPLDKKCKSTQCYETRQVSALAWLHIHEYQSPGKLSFRLIKVCITIEKEKWMDDGIRLGLGFVHFSFSIVMHAFITLFIQTM